MIRKFISTAALALLLTLTPHHARATAQVPDGIILEGSKQIFMLTTNPLSDYLKQADQTRPPGKPFENTANWRGYVATWEVRDNKLWLNDVIVESIKKPAAFANDGYATNSALTTMFKRKGPILADWFSGTLTVPDGEMVEYVHMGYGSTYSHYRIFVVKQGAITARYDVTADEWMTLRRQKFAAFKRTSEYIRLRDELTAKRTAGAQNSRGVEQFDVDQFLFEYFTDSYMAQ